MYCLKYYGSVYTCNSRIRIENERLRIKKVTFKIKSLG